MTCFKKNTFGAVSIASSCDMPDQDPPTPDEMFYLRSYAMTKVIENELDNWGSYKGKKRMEFVGTKLKPDTTNEDLTLLKKHLGKPVDVTDVRRLKNNPYFGWIRPLAVRCISGHSNGAVDLELTTIAISERVKQAIGPVDPGAGDWMCVFHHILRGTADALRTLPTHSRTKERRALQSTYPSVH